MYKSVLLFTLLTIFTTCLAQGQSKSVNVFLDCRGCNETYIRNEIHFVNYVRDKENANVHLLVTRQRTGSGGTEYTLRFIGKQRFEGKSDTLIYISQESDTQDEERKGLVNYVKMGLLPFIAKTPIADNIDITHESTDTVQSTSEEDKWNHWVFEIGGNSYFSGEETEKSLHLSGSVEADRVTPEWKIGIRYDRNYNRQKFEQDGSTETYISQGQWFNGTVVKSLNNHWSAGIFTEASSSTRNNIDYSYGASPAIEYNVFPYEEYAQHEISFRYTLSAGFYNYDELTIFNKLEETLFRQRLQSNMEFTQPWGEFEGRISASSYMHDFNKNRFDIDLELDFRIFRGLSLNVSGRYSWINDQLSIPQGDISDAEQLLNLRQQATSYSYGGSIGLEYTFGSIYNNVVNPRF